VRVFALQLCLLITVMHIGHGVRDMALWTVLHDWHTVFMMWFHQVPSNCRMWL
jgi:hypothetical protein